MQKHNIYRFNLQFDSSDDDHKMVCEYLNGLGRKKARFIVRAIMAFWDFQETGKKSSEIEFKQINESAAVVETQPMEVEGSDKNVEIDLMKKNFAMLDNWE